MGESKNFDDEKNSREEKKLICILIENNIIDTCERCGLKKACDSVDCVEEEEM